MNIEDKLYFTKSSNGLILINEGVFVRAYNESAYILNELLGFNFKITPQWVKKLDNQLILFCGFPKSKIEDYLPKVTKTHFGYQLDGDFCLYFYAKWFDYHRNKQE